jgi:hypothetical protein
MPSLRDRAQVRRPSRLTGDDVRRDRRRQREEGVDWLFSFISAGQAAHVLPVRGALAGCDLEAARRTNVPADKIVEVSRFEPAKLR